MKIPKTYQSPPLKKAFIRGYNSISDKNPYKTEIKNKKGGTTYSRAFINAWQCGRCHAKIDNYKPEKLKI